LMKWNENILTVNYAIFISLHSENTNSSKM
jgi:hypothetical protein